MLIPYKKLCEWADQVEPEAKPIVDRFLVEVETRVRAEINGARECLRHYGIKCEDD